MAEFNVFTATRAELQARIAELELFRIAFMEWRDKTDWVQTDKRFAVLNPWGKHRADVLKEYIQHLESRTVTVKMPEAMRIEGGAYCSAHAHYHSEGDYYDRADIEKMLADSGIKVEAE